ncbi:hypothetical protein DRO66_02570 [Candidatus Bathyarchaeota archaeon]|nr:MAG: hypothetical protein DRO66_02570 [Candidatus Bathyarchaeota archaeon]
MPEYTYECEACEHQFSDIHSFKIVRKKCPECGKHKLGKLITNAPPVHFQGPGWETNSYRPRADKVLGDPQRAVDIATHKRMKE